MSTVVVVGAQYGDEGKGKVIDLFAEKSDVVVRFAGGPNAGHTLVVNGKKTVLRLIPSGILHAHTDCVMAQGMIIDPYVFAAEVEALTAAGLELNGRLYISEAAHLIMPYHIAKDKTREDVAEVKIGTTKKGIGPCYEDKAARLGIRVGDLRDLDLAVKRASVSSNAESEAEEEALYTYLKFAAKTLLPFVNDTLVLVHAAIKVGQNILFEGAQGTLLDIDHGTYPFVTSSSAVAGGACTGAGVGPTKINKVVGVAKAYTTRVGEGPFPSELHDEISNRIREVGKEFGSVTGRPRRVGWLDLRSLRYAAMVNGFDSLALTKFDVLSGLSVSVIDRNGKLVSFEPWKENLGGCQTMNDLPREVRNFIDFIREQVEVPICLISVGPDRKQTIMSGETIF